MESHRIAEEHYQQGLSYTQSMQGERRENLRRALACYELALQSITVETFPEQWQQIQQDMTKAYQALVQIRLQETPDVEAFPRHSRRSHLPLLQRLLLAWTILLLLALPATVLTLVSLEHGNPFCTSGTLSIEGSTDLRPLIEAAARDYMQQCSRALISVREETSLTGLTDVEQGYHRVSREDGQNDPKQIVGQEIPVEMSGSDLFASPVQHDLVDHQIAIGIFVMILNRLVTGVHDISPTQLQGIYTGTYQNWQQICHTGQCGPNLSILPISRAVDSDIHAIFERSLLKGVATIPDLSLNPGDRSSNAVQEVESTPGSVSYAPLFLVNQAHDVIALSIDGQDPHAFFLRENHAYPFWTLEHLYTKGPGSPLAQSFLAYLSGDVTTHLLSRFALLPLTALPQRIRDAQLFEDQE